MEFKGTKGEWKINKSNEISIIDNSGDYFNELICQTNGKSGDERKANAKLIAAAPDLLEACNELIELLSFHGYNNATEIYNAKEAIKKVTE